MNREYIIIWADECESKHMFSEYCASPNAILVDKNGDEAVELQFEDDAFGVKFYTCPKRMKIEIELTAYDVEIEFMDVVRRNETVEWYYDTAEGVPIDVEFISEDEKEQRDR